MNKKIILFLTIFISLNLSADPSYKGNPSWMLPSFMYMTSKHPTRLLDLASNLFSKQRIEKASKKSSLAHEWQHRTAMLSSLSEFFTPELRGKNKSSHQKQAKALISQALINDPSLLVRDAAVESIARIIRMKPSHARLWKKNLEKAFLDSKNQVQGEGLFIRESILRTLRESNLRPSKKIMKAAKADLNPQVRESLRSWETTSFNSL